MTLIRDVEKNENSNPMTTWHARCNKDNKKLHTVTDNDLILLHYGHNANLQEKQSKQHTM